MSAMDLLLDQVQTWELPTGACPFLKTCTKALQFSPKWRCNFLHFYFATFGTFILQQTVIGKGSIPYSLFNGLDTLISMLFDVLSPEMYNCIAEK